MAPLPSRIVGGYWPYWGNPIRLRDIPAAYNVIYLFHATPVGGAGGTTGAVQWNTPGNNRGAATNFRADLAEVRKTRTVILSVGGANANVDLSTRARAQAFLDSVKRIYGDLGGFDGLDWNNYEGHQLPNTDQMIWISQQLKATYGADFAITSPPSPSRQADKDCIRAMFRAGAMDFVSPQYYDWGDGIGSAGHINHLAGTGPNAYGAWAAIAGSASRVGLGVKHTGGADESMTVPDILTAVRRAKEAHPDMRGGFVWEIAGDESRGWTFANQVGPLLASGGSTTPPPPVVPVIPPPVGSRPGTHVVVAGDTYRLIATRYGIARWEDIAELNATAPENLSVGQVLKLPAPVATPTPVPPPAPTPPPPSAVAQVSVISITNSYPLAGVDIPRGADQLVLYTPTSGRVTTTNRYGVEATWREGKIISVNDRLASGSTTGTLIPADGVVISGHDKAADWIRANLAVGTLVLLPQGSVTIASA